MILLAKFEQSAAPIEKHGLTLEEVEQALGSGSLVKELRAIGALEPCARKSKALLFDAAEVSRVWAEFRAGKYDAQLETWRSACA